ncbi:MAG: sulfotransferase family 2 domain-containing protein, partial [Gammaproteobacteria bacterium]
MSQRLFEKNARQAYRERKPYRDDWVANVSRDEVLRGYTVQRGKFLFVWINKTAGLSLSRALGIDKNLYNHYTAMELREILGVEKFASMFKFCFVRNPWDKVVSEFRFRIWTSQNEITADASFTDWVRSTYVDRDPRYHDWPKMFLPQLEWLTDEKGEVAVDFIGRFENLQNDFDKICAAINIDRQVLPHENRSREDKSYRSYYDSETKAVVEEIFKPDIEFFGY